MSNASFYTIGDFSRLTRLSIRMLRHYDQHGVLPPHHVDPFSGYRSYHHDQLRAATRIRQLRDVGFGVKAIAAILSTDSPEQLREALLIQQAQVSQERDRADGQLANLEMLLTSLQKGTVMTDITRTTLPAFDALFLRRTIPAYDQEAILWQELMDAVRPEDMKALTETPPCGAIFHDPEYKESDVDVEIWQTITHPVEVDAPIELRRHPAVEVLMTTHRGSYEGIGETMDALAAELAPQQLQVAGPMFNRYVVSPAATGNPDEYVTEVCIPVRG